jgi:nucleotide-binding universal stress UspA family protein
MRAVSSVLDGSQSEYAPAAASRDMMRTARRWRLTMAEAIRTLLAVDGSEQALGAVRHALKLAQAGLQMRFVLVNVQEPASLYEVMVAHDAERLAQLRREAGADQLSAAQALLDAAGVACEMEVAGGAPEHLIVELAENYDCDLIVIGARGIGAVPGDSGLGSVARAVLESAPVPVMMVRTPEPSALDSDEVEGAADEAAAPPAG